MSDTPRTFQARLIIEAGDWRNEKDCTDYALKVAEELECELVAILESHRTLVHKNMELKNEIAELNAWKSGMKGVEEFYAMRHRRDEWRNCAESLVGALVNAQDVDRDFVDAAVDEFIRLASKP